MMKKIRKDYLTEFNNLTSEKFLISTSFAFSLASIITGHQTLLIISILFIFIDNFLFSLKNINKYIVFLLFNVTFVFFLYSRFFVTGILGYTKNNYVGYYDLGFVDINNIKHILFSMYISIIGLSGTYKLIIKNHFRQKCSKKGKINLFDRINLIFTNDKFVKSIRKTSLIIFLIAVVFKFFYLYNEINFVKNVGYYQSYILDRPANFRILNLIGDMSYASYYIYLASKPNLKKSLFATLLFLGSSSFELLTGVRNPFMLNILIVITYYIIQLKIIIIDRKKFLALLGISLVAIILMIYIGGFRGTKSNSEEISSNQNIIIKILDFFHGQGVSASTIGYARLYNNIIPNKPYFLSVPIDFVKLEILGRFIPSFSGDFSGQTVELATLGNQFQQLISYLIFPYEYLNQGLGLGSSFISELYLFLGYFGIVLGSSFYGYIIYIFTKWIKENNILLCLLGLFMCRDLFFTPRASFSYFMYNLLTETQLFTIFITFITSYFIYKVTKEEVD